MIIAEVTEYQGTLSFAQKKNFQFFFVCYLHVVFRCRCFVFFFGMTVNDSPTAQQQTKKDNQIGPPFYHA